MSTTTIDQLNVVTRYVSDLDKKSVEKTKKGVNGLTKTIKQAAAAFSAAVILRGLADIGISAVNNAAKFETISTSFKVLTGDVKTAAKFIDDLNKKSLATPFTPEELQQVGKTLLSFGRTVKETLQDIDILGEVSAATGAPLQQLGVIFGQVAGAGKLAGQDALQFVNAGIPVYQLLAESTGHNIQELKKLQEQGKITFEDLRTAFANAALAGGKFEGALKLQSQTLAGLRSTNTGVWEEVSRAIGLKALPAAKNLTRIFIRLGESVLGLVAPQKDVVKGLKDEQIAFNSQLEILKKLNPESEAARRVRENINTVYKDYLPNLLTEKNSLDEIRKAQEKANKAFVGKIILAELEEELKPLRKELEATAESLVQTELQAGRFASGQLTDLEKALAGAPTAKLREDFQKFKKDIETGVSSENLKNNIDRVNKIIESITEKYDVLAQKLLGKTLEDLGGVDTVITTPTQENTKTVAKEIKKNLEDFLETNPVELFKDSGGDFLEQIQAQTEKEKALVEQTEKELFELRKAYKEELSAIDINDAEAREKLTKTFGIAEIETLIRLAQARKEVASSGNETQEIRDYILEIAELRIQLQQLKNETQTPDDFVGSIIKDIFGDDADVQGIKDGYRTLFSEIGQLYSALRNQRREDLDREVSDHQARINEIVAQRGEGSKEILEIEQRRLDEAQAKQEQFAKNQQSLAQAVAAAELIAAIAKIASQTGITAPAAIPLVLASILGFMKAVPGIIGLADGTAYVQGAGTHRSDSVPAMLSKGEGVLAWKDNKRRLHIKDNSKLIDYALIGENVSKGYISPAVTQVLQINSKADNKELIKEIKQLYTAIVNLEVKAENKVDQSGVNQLVRLGQKEAQRDAHIMR